MSFLSNFYTYAGMIPLIHSRHWSPGKIIPVFASQFLGNQGRYELDYLKQYYRNYDYDYIHDSLFASEGFTQEGQPLLGRCFDYSDVTFDDRIDVFAHGNEDGMYSLSLQALATYFKSKGLRSVGVIKFNVCRSGLDKYFLLNAKCIFLLNGISFAWMSAPRGDINYFPPFKYISGHILKEDRYRLLNGNITKKFPGTKYVYQ
ncbi:hypothetical protein [Cedecea sp.]|jgi:hypothetical protein|uniref:hypothetical protein n=1 Tax=Cedecea sp. TaxID=1970739 RepID=UPI002F3F88A9